MLNPSGGIEADLTVSCLKKNYFRIIPEGYKIEEITHGTNANPNLITVNEVIKNITRLKN